MDDRAQVRCPSCGHVDYPVAVRRGPGWLALLLWVATAAAWAVSWYGATTAFTTVFWALLLLSMLYTLWYFWTQETACRSCGARELEAHAHADE
ncbi:MAG: hypothetical protein ACRELV_10940 [Longimicrobiales bacterium]